jgi:hypothetical protein
VSTLNVLNKTNTWIGIALCAGLFVLPFPAHADSSNEVAMAADHAGLSAASNTLLMAHTHLHHTLNCLVGPNGQGFDTKAVNPCANLGKGAIPDSTDARTRRELDHIAYQVRRALRSHTLSTVKEDAARIEAELKKVG